MPPVISVSELRKSFRPGVFGQRRPALRGISFSVGEGGCFGLLGRNGAGKTTALKIVTGLLWPDSGEARLFGQPCGTAAARRQLGYLPESPYFHEHLTPREGLAMFGALSGMDRAEVKERSAELLERVGLTESAGQRIRGFSKGMRQRYGLAASLLHRPLLLMLDEPLSGLDPSGRRLVKEIILEERARGSTVFLCSHVLADVQELCDRVVVLDRGTVLQEGTIEELLDSEPSSYELCADRVPAALRQMIEAAALRYRESGETITAHVPGDAGPSLAAQVHAAGGRILSLIPERESLEKWFVRLTSASSAEEEEVVQPLEERETQGCA